MRILHVNDVAGVAVNLAKYQTRLGHNVCVVMRNRTLVGLHETFLSVSNKKHHGIVNRSLNVFRFYCYVAAFGRRFDVIHIHTQYLVWFFLPFKKKLLEFHGSDVRKYPNRNWAIDGAITKLFLTLFSRGVIR